MREQAVQKLVEVHSRQRCKGPEAGACLFYMRNKRGVCEGVGEGEIVRDEVRGSREISRPWWLSPRNSKPCEGVV